MGERGRGRRPVVRGRAAVSQLAPVEGAAAGGASGEAEAVRRGGVGDAVDGRHRVPLGAGRHGDAAEVEDGEKNDQSLNRRGDSFSTAGTRRYDFKTREGQRSLPGLSAVEKPSSRSLREFEKPT